MNNDVAWSGIFALIGVILGSGLSWGVEWHRDRLDTKRMILITAAVCSAQLRVFADQCGDVAFDDGTYLGQMGGRYDNGEEYLDAQIDPPELPGWPTDIRWDVLKSENVQAIFRLPIQYRRLRGALTETRLNDFPPFVDTFADRQTGYARMALHILWLSSQLEQFAGLKPIDDSETKRRLENLLDQFTHSSAGIELSSGDHLKI